MSQDTRLFHDLKEGFDLLVGVWSGECEIVLAMTVVKGEMMGGIQAIQAGQRGCGFGEAIAFRSWGGVIRLGTHRRREE